MERRARRDQSMSAQNRRTLHILVEQAERLSRLINSLLDISRIQTGLFSLERSLIDLCIVCRRVAADVQVTTERHRIELICPEAPIVVEGDDLRLEQMLQNLLQNAIKYSPAGGPITVQLQRDSVSAVLSVSDQGIGIPQEAYSRLFQPYYRAGNSAGSVIGGMGLGLYVVKELVERHNGSIEVISAEGQGSTFIVRLPLSVAHPPAD
jgi:signal transduction histidine kinase